MIFLCTVIAFLYAHKSVYMKATLLLCSFFFYFTSCQNKQLHLNNTSADSTIGKKSGGYNIKQLIGVFYDTLPCADCPGIATKIYLKPDNTFIIEREYINKRSFYETGTWTMSDSLLQLKSEDSVEQFKIMSHAELHVLDKDGKETEVASKQVVLHRNNIPFKPVAPIPIEGMFSMANNAVNIHICTMQKTYPASLAPTALFMTSAYKKAAPKGEPVYAKVAGHFELRPSLANASTEDFFIIDKFIRFLPAQSCK